MKPTTPCNNCGGAPSLNCFDHDGKTAAICAGWCPACGKMGELCEEPAEAIAKWDAENARQVERVEARVCDTHGGRLNNERTAGCENSVHRNEMASARARD